MMSQQCVYLVGTGPGDPDLLTVKALRLIHEADVIVYDRLVSDEIMQQVPQGIPRIYVGKKTGQHTFTQKEINQLLIKLANSNRSVVRLKGGDPFIFGRGSEEAMELSLNNVCFEVVPGITAASACTTYAGIPLTHRGLANNVQIITGHAQDDGELNLDWQALCKPQTTIVVYMGLANLRDITDSLIDAGLAADTPAAAIENGSTRRQRSCTATLATLGRRIAECGFRAPVMIVIGDVVCLSETLSWFETEDLTTDSAYERTQTV